MCIYMIDSCARHILETCHRAASAECCVLAECGYRRYPCTSESIVIYDYVKCEYSSKTFPTLLKLL